MPGCESCSKPTVCLKCQANMSVFEGPVESKCVYKCPEGFDQTTKKGASVCSVQGKRCREMLRRNERCYTHTHIHSIGCNKLASHGIARNIAECAHYLYILSVAIACCYAHKKKILFQ